MGGVAKAAPPRAGQREVSVDNRVSFDTALRDAGVPENAPARPVGTLDEIQSFGLNPEHYPSCSKPNKQLGIRGCGSWDTCLLSYKGKSLADGGGPRRMAWERIFKGKPVRRVEGECWDVARDQVFVEDNNGALRIIAAEGESYDKLEGVAVKTFVNEKGDTVKQIAKDGETHLPNVQRQDMVVKKTVKPFVRVNENSDIAVDVITADVIRKEHERIFSESVPSALGIAAGGTPIDKRHKRAGEGQSKG
jgi:hypothetical protein